MTEFIQIGVMGPGETGSSEIIKMAERLGAKLAKAGYITFTGGLAFGVMDAALKGAYEAGGLTIGILSSKEKEKASEYAKIVIPTGMHSARNYINALASSVMVAFVDKDPGTLSEVALAMKVNTPVILVTRDETEKAYISSMIEGHVEFAQNENEILDKIKKII